MLRFERLVGVCGLIGLCPLGCGGVAATSADPSPSAELPVAGSYLVNIDTATDCSPAPPAHETREEQLSPDANGVNGSFWSNAREEVPWTGVASPLGGCQSSVRIQVTEKSSRSFALQSDWLWVDPGRCSLGAAAFPPSACNARQFAMYELVEP